MDGDPKAYYATLGVHPGASDKLIRAAFRVQAQELHPDLNPSPDAKEKFQRLNAAYMVLSDPEQRQRYDALSGEPSSRKPSAETPDGRRGRPTSSAGFEGKADEGESKSPSRSANWQPLTCQRCGSVSALPRYREYHHVTGLLFHTSRTTSRGVFCAKCDALSAAKATAITAFAGWWSYMGWLYSPAAILNNLTAGLRFREKNVAAWAHQAGYFASRGKTDIARAIAEEVLKVKATWSPLARLERTRRAKLGYETPQPLEDAKAFALSLLASVPLGNGAVTLRHDRFIANRRIGYQLVSLVPVYIVVGAVLMSWTEEHDRERRQAAWLENERFREAIEQVQAVPSPSKAAPAVGGVAELTASPPTTALPAEPLPATGLWHYESPLHAIQAQSEQLPQLIVTASNDLNYLVKLERQTGEAVVSVFVRAGETAEIAVPLGIYRIKLAAGHRWYGEHARFGPETKYSVIDGLSEFKLEGSTLVGKRLELRPIKNGNLHKTRIVAEQF